MQFASSPLGPETYHYVHHASGVERHELNRPDELRGRRYAVTVETTRQPTIDMDGNLLGYAGKHPSNQFTVKNRDELSYPNYAGPIVSMWGSGIFAQNILCDFRGTLASYGYIHVAKGNVTVDIPRLFNPDTVKIYSKKEAEIIGGKLKHSTKKVPILSDAEISKHKLLYDRYLGISLTATKEILLREMVRERFLAIVCLEGKVTINRTQWP